MTKTVELVSWQSMKNLAPILILYFYFEHVLTQEGPYSYSLKSSGKERARSAFLRGRNWRSGLSCTRASKVTESLPATFLR